MALQIKRPWAFLTHGLTLTIHQDLSAWVHGFKIKKIKSKNHPIAA
jgi:hypothetical protein